MRAFHLKREGRIDDALDCVERVLRQDPRSATAWLNKGILSMQQQPGSAYLYLREAIALDPGLPVAHTMVGTRARTPCAVLWRTMGGGGGGAGRG